MARSNHGRRHGHSNIAGGRPYMELLEPRRLLSTVPHVVSVAADNRGLVVLLLDADLNASTVNTSSAKIFTAGADGKLGTGDDVAAADAVNYNAALKAITLQASLAPDTPYRIFLDASQIKSSDGTALDGEFNGLNQPSGNGTPGGNFDVVTRPANTEARFSTVAGWIDVNLYPERAPQTVNNFITYADAGDWDNTFFHRNVPGFVIQGGGFNYNSSTNKIGSVPANAAVVNEPGISNTVGTIAMAKLGSDPNSATNQWFFNAGDNASNLDAQNGGFTVFGTIANSSGLNVMNAINGLSDVNAGGAFNQLPVLNAQAVINRGNQIDPATDLVMVNRVALLMGVQATSNPPVVQAVAADQGSSEVRLYGPGGANAGSFFAFPGFDGAVRVAMADFNGDGVPDIVAATGPGASHIKIFNGATLQEIPGPLSSFLAFPGPGTPADSTYFSGSFTGGVQVAAGDINHDGTPDLIVAADAGGESHVKVFSGADGSLLRSFFSYPGYDGGVNIASGDINGDGYADIITGAATDAPHVKVFSGADNSLLDSFMAYESYPFGVNVGAGDVEGLGHAQVITGTTYGPPDVRVFDGDGTVVDRFLAYDQGFWGGVRVATADFNGSGHADILTATASGAVHFKAFSLSPLAELESFIDGTLTDQGLYIAAAG